MKLQSLSENYESDLFRARELVAKQSRGYYSRSQIDEIAKIMVDKKCGVIHACFIYGKKHGMINRYASCGCADCAKKPKQKKLW